ncbi:Guanine nucleotide-binding protein-like 3, partial [Modicella reniformis]
MLMKKKRAAEAKQLQKDAREKAMNKNRKIISNNNNNNNSTLSIHDIAQQAAARGQEFDASAVEAKADDGVREAVDSAAVGGKDNSRKDYYREFRKDIILEILEARNPLDLAPRENVESWLKYLRNEYPTIAFKASTQNQRTNLGQSNIGTDLASEDMLTSSE